MGASSDQTVVVLSMEKGTGREDVTQETLRTGEFPVKVSFHPTETVLKIAMTDDVLARGMV